MQKLLTIVIPTYNMQDYLRRCLDSLIVKSELMERFEVLVVNDGSKDNSSTIGHEYETRYPATFRVIDKENGNYGSCVNRGLSEAQGKYIKVLDADDWFNVAEFEKYLATLNDVEVDLVLTDFSIVNSDNMEATLAYHPNLRIGYVYPFKECTLEEVGVYMMHAVTYRTELLRSISYQQTQGISYTDTEWAYNPLYAVNSMVYYGFNVYQYLVGREGQTMDPKVMVRTINHHEIIARSLIDNAKLHQPTGFPKITIERQIVYLLEKVYRTRLVLQDSDSFNQKEMEAFDQYVKDERPDLYQRVGRLRLKRKMPIRYVRYWRKHGKRFPVDGIRVLYRRMKYGSKSH